MQNNIIQPRERRPQELRHYHAKLMEDIEDAEWLLEDDDPVAASALTKECGIYATED